MKVDSRGPARCGASVVNGLDRAAMRECEAMSETYGMHVEFTAQLGRGDELEALLLDAAAGTASIEDCLLYVVSRAVGQADVVTVTEAWTSEAAHDESLKDPEARALIERAMPLMAAAPKASRLRPVGGKGL
jgi:quinol monooxygenase YgiN